MKTYTVIAGVNGVGKSSFTGVLKTERTDLGCVIDMDKILSETQLGRIKAGKLALERIESALSKGLSFTQETTLSGYFIEKTAKRAKHSGYIVRMFYIGLNSFNLQEIYETC